MARDPLRSERGEARFRPGGRTGPSRPVRGSGGPRRGLLSLLLVLLLLSPAGAAESFRVLSFSPQGEIRTPRPVKVVFSTPAAPPEAVGKPLEPGRYPIRLSPALPGVGKWTDDRTFVLAPRRLPQATRWTVAPAPGLKDREGALLAGDQVFSFSTPRLRFLGARQTDFTPEGRVSLELRFSLPVLPARLRGFLSARRQENEVRLEIPSGPPSDRILLKAPGGGPLTLILAAGLTSEAGPLGIEREIRTKLTSSLAFEVREAEAASDFEVGRIHVRTSAPVDPAKVRPFLRLRPETKVRIEPTDQGFDLVGPFSPRDRVEVTLMKGLPSKNGSKLRQDYLRAFLFPDREAAIRFASPGRVLSPLNDRRLTLESVNLDAVDVTVFRLYENNLPFVLRSRPWLDDFPLDLTRQVTTRTFRTDAEPNRIVRRTLDLGKLVGSAQGVFLVTARDPSNRAWQEARTLVNLTDLGLVARVERTGALIWVNSLKKGTPLSGAKVTLWSGSHQPVAEGRSDGEGLLRIRRDRPFEPDLQPVLATASRNGDISYIRLDENLFDRSGLDLAGRPYPYASGGAEAMLFLPRGVFRPGETVTAKALVRDGSLRPPRPFPVLFAAYAPDGREVRRATVRLSEEGTALFALPLDDAAPTGEWRIRVCVPGEETPLGEAPLLVEDFAPPRLAIRPRSDRPRLTGHQGARIDFEARWLFGAPASDLPYEVELTASPRDFTPAGWGDFVFGDPSRRMDPTTETVAQGTLTEGGLGSLQWKGGSFAPPAQVDLAFRIGVMEEGGRWVYQSLILPLDPYGLQVGIGRNLPDLAAGRRALIPLAAVTPDGRAAPLDRLKVTLSRVVRSGLFADDGGTLRWQEQEQILPLGTAEVPLRAGRGAYALLPKEGGEYLIRAEDPASGAAASTRVVVPGAFDAGNASFGGAPSRGTILLDRKRYRPGETVEARITTPFPARVLFTVETDRVLLYRVLRTEGKPASATIRFKAEEGMTPNAWCALWAIRPVGPEKDWTSHRAFGAAELPLDREDRRLRVELTAPARLLPERKAPISLQLRDAGGKGVPGEVALALVDEGILSLTGYVPPDPFAFFTARRGQSVPGYDLYDDLIPLETAGAPLLRPGGDEGAGLMVKRSLSPVSARRFKPFALLLPSVRTDASGRASVSLALPDFAGSARLMAVATAGDRLGSAERSLRIAADLVLEPSLPRAAAPLDRFEAPILLANTTSRDLPVRLRVSASGPLGVKLERELTVRGGGSLSVPAAYAAANASGRATVRFEATWPGGRDARTVELPIRPASPPIRRVGSGVIEPGRPVALTPPGGWFPGTGRFLLSFGGGPRVQTGDAARFLLSYPYGCLEQTVSSAWPPLIAPDLVRGLDPRLAPRGASAALVKEKIRRIQALQLYDGSFALWPGDGSPDLWGGVYATHFLLEARRRLPGSVPPLLLDPALRNLRSLLPLSPERPEEPALRDMATTKAYAAYVLARNGEPPLGWMEHLRSRTGDLRPAGRSFLAAAYALAGQKAEAKRLLGASAPSSVPLPRGGGTLDGPVRDRAVRLLAWFHVEPRGAEAAREAAALLSDLRRLQEPTTQESAFALYALGLWFEANPTPKTPVEVRAAEGGTVRGVVSGDAERLLSGAPGSSWTLTASGGRGYYAWTAEGVPLAPPSDQDRGLALRVSLRDRKGKPLPADRPVPRGTALIGEIRLKALSGVPEDLVVVWPLAGGLEIENPRLTAPLPGEKAPQGEEENAPAVRAELRDDRLILFVERLDRPLVWRFALRAVTAGRFALPAASATGMYDPGLQSLRRGGILEIR